MRFFSFLFFFGIILYSSCSAWATNFPYRDKFPEIKTIELAELKSGYASGEYLIIDVRSKAEFEAIHIKGAINLPYAELKFISRLQKKASENADKKIVVYDNGINCIKCYKAAEDALYALVKNVIAFDGGISSWAKAYPAETTFMGKELKKNSKQLFSSFQLNARKITFDLFKEKSTNEAAVVIDARDPIQKTHELPGLEKSLHLPVDKLVNNIISKGHMQEKELLIFDQVGGQVNWLMYYLTENGYTNFYFLKGGTTSVLKEQEYRAGIAAIMQ
jgi:rhodanese-related sulfurtransferase